MQAESAAARLFNGLNIVKELEGVDLSRVGSPDLEVIVIHNRKLVVVDKDQSFDFRKWIREVQQVQHRGLAGKYNPGLLKLRYGHLFRSLSPEGGGIENVCRPVQINLNNSFELQLVIPYVQQQLVFLDRKHIGNEDVALLTYSQRDAIGRQVEEFTDHCQATQIHFHDSQNSCIGC